MPAFELAVAQGADGLELDVHVTADDVPVVIHDPTLDRTTDRSGPVVDLPVARVREADAGARFTPDGVAFPFRGRGVRVPLLAEVIDAFPGLPLLIEVKAPRVQLAVRRVLLEHNAEDRCVVAASEADALDAFRQPPFLLGASRNDIARLWLRSLLGFAADGVAYRLLAVPVRYRGLPVPTRRFVAAARRLGCPVHVWTVNDVGQAARLWRRGVCGIVTDRPGAIRGARRGPP